MTSKNSEQAKKRQELITSYGIKFWPDIEPTKWPSNHAKHFQNILSLGSTRYSAWEKDVWENWETQPWKNQTRRRLKDIVASARECRDDEDNESTWRRGIEGDIYTRFSDDASCDRCNERLWRSGIDPRTACDEGFLENLPYDEESCSCEHNGPNAGERDKIKLFAIKNETQLMYTPHEKACLDRSGEKPDTIVSLKVIGTLKKSLQAAKQGYGSSGRVFEDCLKTSLRPNEKNPVVFPFIVGESKSEDGESFEKINLQVALAIKRSLDLQDGLCKEAGPKRTWVAGPLVWCISYRGASWRVSAGYMSSRKPYKIEVSTLWHGLITDYEDALQLVLIMDYIYDWARYIHREIIIRELMNLGLPSVDELSDMFSNTGITVNSYQGHRPGFRPVYRAPSREVPSTMTANIANSQSNWEQRIADWNRPEQNSGSSSAAQQDMLRQHDRYDIVIRDPRYITSRMVGSFITRANFDKLLGCMSQLDPEISSNFLSNILKELDYGKPFYLNRSLLCEIESTWTGLYRTLEDNESPDDTFQVLLTVSYYVGLDWGLVREICYFAISEEAKELLRQKVSGKRRSSVRRRRSGTPSGDIPTVTCSSNDAQLLINSFQAGSVDDVLSHCLNRLSLRLTIGSLNTRNIAMDTREFVFQMGPNQCRLTPIAPALPHRIIWEMQTYQGTTRNARATTLLHISMRCDDQSLFQGLNTGIEVNRNFANQIAILALTASLYDPTDATRSCGLCVYALDRPKLGSFAKDLVEGGLRVQHRMQTTRLDHESDEEFRWNVKSVDQGVSQMPARFMPFFQNLVTRLHQSDGEETISYNKDKQVKNMTVLTDILVYRNTCEDEDESDEETVKEKESDDDYVESVEDEDEDSDVWETGESDEEEEDEGEEKASKLIPDRFLHAWSLHPGL